MPRGAGDCQARKEIISTRSEAGYEGTMSNRTMGSHQSARALDTVWLTPPELLRALGPFDLDPCACPEPRPWPTAARHVAPPECGLAARWEPGERIWLNPPFSPRPTIEAFLGRLAEHGTGTALLFARTETDLFFRLVWDRAHALLFLKGRPHFHRRDGARARANSGCPVVLAAYGWADAERLSTSGLAGRFVPLK